MKLKANEDFFDEISPFYDEMIGFSSALNRRRDLLKKFMDEKIKTAADLGCGSGLDSIALAGSGIEMTAFDQSSRMINRATENAGNEGVEIKFYKTSLDKIPKAFDNKFDLALSLGNTLANLNSSKLEKAIGRIHSILRDNGKAVFQILNYSAILKNQERIVNITEQSGNIYVRFYDFYPGYLNFNILKFKKEAIKESSLYTTKLYPYDFTEFSQIMKQFGFRSIEKYGNLNLDSFQKHESGDLVIVAQK